MFRRCIFYLILQTSYSSLKPPQIEDNLSRCVQKEIAFLFKPEDTLTVYLEQNHDMFGLNKINNPRWIFNIINNHKSHFSYNYIIFSRNAKTLLETFQKLINSTQWHLSHSPRGRFLLLIQNSGNEDEILKYFWNNNIYNVILGAQSNISKEMLLFYANPYNDENSCGKFIRRKTISRCGEISFEKPLNLSSCELKVGVLFNMVPFTEIPFTNKRSMWIEPFKIMTEKLEWKVTYFPFDKYESKDYFQHGSYNTTIRYVNEGMRDVFVAAMSKYLVYYEYFDPTEAFFYDIQVWVVQKPHFRSNIKILLSLFKAEIWIGILVSAVLSSALFWVTTGNDYIWELMQCLVMNCGISVAANYRKLRLFYTTLIFCSMLISYFFQARLSSVLTAPIEKRGIRTVEELIDSNFDIIIPVQKINLFKTIDDPKAQKLYAISKPVAKYVTREHYLTNPYFATTIYKASYDVSSAINRKMRIIGRDFLHKMETCYCLKKGHPLIPLFNKYARRIVEAGLHQNWLLDWQKLQPDSESISKLVALTVQHVNTALIFLGVGYISSVLIFIGEMYFTTIKFYLI